MNSSTSFASNFEANLELMRGFLAHDVRGPLQICQRRCERILELLAEIRSAFGTEQAFERSHNQMRSVERIVATVVSEDELRELFDRFRNDSSREDLHSEFHSYLAALLENIRECKDKTIRFSKRIKAMPVETGSFDDPLASLIQTLKKIGYAVYEITRLTRHDFIVMEDFNPTSEIRTVARSKAVRNLKTSVITVTDPNRTTFIEANPLHIRFLSRQIIFNGIKYSGRNDTVIRIIVDRISRVPEALRDSLGRAFNGEICYIVFDDNGPGMSETEIKKVLNVKRIMSELPSVGENDGMGIGLSLCRQIAELYDGALHISSEPGVGTRVHLLLPVAEEDI